MRSAPRRLRLVRRCLLLRSWLPFRQHARAEGRVEASPRCWHHPGACRPAGRLVVDYKSASGPVTFLTPLEASACGVSRETSPLNPSGGAKAAAAMICLSGSCGAMLGPTQLYVLMGWVRRHPEVQTRIGHAAPQAETAADSVRRCACPYSQGEGGEGGWQCA